MTLYYRADFRSMIFLKYLGIGASDVLFWWSVWYIADYFIPIHNPVPSNGHITFIYGYIFVLVANLIYLSTRICFKKFLGQNEDIQQEIYATSIVTITQSKPERPGRRAILARCLFPISVYFLTLGFIHIWRGYFALFYYIVEEVLAGYGMSMVLSRVLLILMVGVTLIFNQTNNTVNLCPTHKMFKFDTFENLESLFKMHILIGPGSSENNNDIVIEGTGEEPVTNQKEDSDELVTSPFHHEFSSALNLAELLKSFHKTERGPIFPRKWYRDKAPTFKHLCGPAEHVRINIDIITLLSRSCGMGLVENVGLLNEECLTNDETPKDLKPTVATDEKRESVVNLYVEVYQSGDDKFIENGRKPNEPPSVTENDHAEGKCGNELKTICSDETSKCTCGRIMVKKLSKTVTPQELDELETQIAAEYKELNKIGSQPKTKLLPKKPKTKSCPKNCLHCRVARIISYIYIIHYEHVFLNTFGAIFWSSTWGLFDMIVSPIFTDTPKDISWLLLVAITAHCVNHLVLFRLKETSSTLRWRTVCEFLCGLCTVCFWASMWHTLDLVNKLILGVGPGVRVLNLPLLLVAHTTVFFGLSVLRLAINVAL